MSAQDKKQFLLDAITDHKNSQAYEDAKIAQDYADGKNVTISKYQKVLYTLAGKAVPDNYTANHKCKSGFFERFVIQETAFEVGNGVIFQNEATKKKLGKNIDTILYEGTESALIQGVSFGFYNLDHLEFFKLTEFVPLFDEETGLLMAGIRFWQLSENKPMRITLYEIDGYTEFTSKDDAVSIVKDKRNYKQIVHISQADGEETEPGGNYSGFPIVPLYGNRKHQSELIGRREQIDAYDLIKSGFANDLDDASMIYWTLTNCGGMDDIDLAKFVERMKTVKAAVVDGDNVKAEAHTIDVPYQSREAYLTRLEIDLYKDFMALNVSEISAGNKTATEIEAAYEALNQKADGLEMQLYKFFDAILKIAEIDDIPEFKRSIMINTTERIQNILAAAEYLGDEETTRQICGVLNLSDKFDDIMKQRIAEETSRFEEEVIEE